MLRLLLLLITLPVLAFAQTDSNSYHKIIAVAGKDAIYIRQEEQQLVAANKTLFNGDASLGDPIAAQVRWTFSGLLYEADNTLLYGSIDIAATIEIGSQKGSAQISLKDVHYIFTDKETGKQYDCNRQEFLASDVIIDKVFVDDQVEKRFNMVVARLREGLNK